jgi:hypothetical protein
MIETLRAMMNGDDGDIDLAESIVRGLISTRGNREKLKDTEKETIRVVVRSAYNKARKELNSSKPGRWERAQRLKALVEYVNQRIKLKRK